MTQFVGTPLENCVCMQKHPSVCVHVESPICVCVHTQAPICVCSRKKYPSVWACRITHMCVCMCNHPSVSICVSISVCVCIWKHLSLCVHAESPIWVCACGSQRLMSNISFLVLHIFLSFTLFLHLSTCVYTSAHVHAIAQMWG